MEFVIARDTIEVEYKNNSFWKQFDEVKVENPNGWYIRYVSGGIVHTFGYCQSTGRGDYYDEYVEQTHKIPLNFSDDAKANAEIMHKADYDRMQNVVLIRQK